MSERGDALAARTGRGTAVAGGSTPIIRPPNGPGVGR